MAHMGLIRTVAPTSEPVSLGELRAHRRIDDDAQDTALELALQAAREYVEDAYDRSLLTQTWRLALDAFPCDGERSITLPRGPLQSVTSITYVDTDGVTQTWSSGNYRVDTYSDPGRIELGYGLSWPSTRDVVSAVLITYVAGWAASTYVPATVRAAVLMLASHYHEHPEAVAGPGALQVVPLAVESLLLSAWPGTYR